ncbi:hypothetical protein [Roseibium sediminicola]|uniref:Uncharacterized protein n=1 Tax=Roseibium sediminicola TaxID=2933272 RepID=A0ABT0GVS2_9HYPH|nr:hypothetical protein [Roseibium sp. CAU 1639]MCK7612913.1 hypothetical protein [Roseibium sp. CAU 1639]
MATFSAQNSDLIGKSQAEVFAKLGVPERQSRWFNRAREAQDPDTSDTDPGDIWVYRNGLVTFSLSGKVLELEDDASDYFSEETLQA